MQNKFCAQQQLYVAHGLGQPLLEGNFMSTLALVWIDSIQVGNSTAKALLRYLASHNFHKPGFFFKNSTYTKALEISEKTLQRTLSFLEEKNYITIDRRYDEHGRQISNGIFLNIPEEFITSYEKLIEEGVNLSQGEGVNLSEHFSPVKMSSLGASKCRGGGRQNDAPYNNNKNNNKLNSKRESTLHIFKPNDYNISFAKDLGISVETEATSFIQKKPITYQTQEEFTRWLMLAKEHKDKKIVKPSNEIRSTLIEYGPGHPVWEEKRQWERENAKNSQGSEAGRDNTRRNSVQPAKNYLF